MRGDRYTMSEAHSMSRSTGQGLLTLGADKGDTVAVILPNMPEWVPVLLLLSSLLLLLSLLPLQVRLRDAGRLRGWPPRDHPQPHLHSQYGTLLFL